jgi:hypothetical protein
VAGVGGSCMGRWHTESCYSAFRFFRSSSRSYISNFDLRS